MQSSLCNMQSQCDPQTSTNYVVEWLLTRVDSNSYLDLGVWKVWYVELLGSVEDVQSGIADLHYMSCAISLWQTGHQHVGIANGFHLETRGWV